MTAIDPHLPAQLRWGANQVDAIVADPFWNRPFWNQNSLDDGNVSAMWYSAGDAWTANVWVGRAADAHGKEMEAAKRKVASAYQQLVALRDELERQAQAATNQLEAQALIDQLTKLLRQF